MKNTYLYFILFIAIIFNAQPVESNNHGFNNSQPTTSSEINNTTNQVWSITVCDDDFDGITTFTFDEIVAQLNEEFQDSTGAEDEVWIANSYNGIIKIENVSTNPNRVFVCDYSDSLYEIAINQDMTVFVSTRNGLHSVNTETCNYTRVGSLPESSNLAMSFDTQNNLYVGGRHSKVYRADAGQFDNYYVWHDFGAGSSGGDFVVIGEYMYIAWAINYDNYLYKVTLDDDNQYVSHENLGMIDDQTFGLAAENGVLYGVTPDYLYSIDLPSLNTQRIIQNSSITPWWGAAGLHEAISYDFSFHLTQQQAQDGSNPLDESFSNSVPYYQQIFIRIYNETTDETEVITLDLNVVTPPETVATSLYQCATGNELGVYNLTMAIPSMLDDISGVDISYYNSLNDAENQNNPINNPDQFQATSEDQVIYVRFANGECTSFNTITLQNDAATLDLESDLSFCEGQSITISPNASFDTYEWSGLQGDDLINNDINSSEITVTQAGTYILTVGYGDNCTLTEQITVSEESLPIFTDQVLSFCSDSQNVSVSSAELISNLNEVNPSLNYTLFNSETDANNGMNQLAGNLNLNDQQNLIVKVKNNANSDCFTLNELSININLTPDFELTENLSLCQGESLRISVPNSFVSYQWSGLQNVDAEQNDLNSNEVEITQAGTYTLEVFNDNCSVQKQVTVTYEEAATIQSVSINGNDASIIATGTPPLEYSFDGATWSTNPSLTDLAVGEYTAYVRGENVCGVTEFDFALFSFTNVITPNNDGLNDTWYVKGLEAYPGTSVKIFDRYGKLLVDEIIDSRFEWNGTHNGKKLPSNSYWYLIEVVDGRKYSGHITVKNYK